MNYCPSTFSLVHPPPFPSQSTEYRDSVWLGGGGGLLCCVGDHILQEFNILFLTRFRTNDDLFHRLETVRFFRLFTGEGDMENTGRGNTEPRGLKARVLPWLPSCPDLLERRCGWACFALWWKLRRACDNQGLSKNAQLQATVIYSCLCSLHFVM